MLIPTNWLKEIVDLPKDLKELCERLTSVGHMLDKTMVKDSEVILDLELRGNRADCYSILGIAREISAIYGSKLKDLPKLDKLEKVKKLKNSSLDIKTKYVKRAAMVEIYDIKLTKSPKWLSQKLVSYGLESVNNIVDLTNFIMIEMGEPMHAFDLDKVRGGLEIRLAKQGEKITTFQGTTLTLTNDDLVWSKGKEVLSVAGAIGEKHHSISDSTKNVLLEAANYDQANIRRTVHRHNLFTDAGIRHEKNLDPNMVSTAIERFLYFIKKYKWGEFDANIYDYYPNPIKPWTVPLDLNYLKRFSGIEITQTEIKKILTSLNFKILKENKNEMLLEVPTYRTDVTLEEDIIEEILRIYGYDKLPSKKLSLEIPKVITPRFIKQEKKLKRSAIMAAFIEVITLPFVPEEYSFLNKSEGKNENIATVVNPPSPDLKNLRISLVPNLYQNAIKIIQERGETLRLFEIGKTYHKKNNSYKEMRKMAFFYWKEKGNDFKAFKYHLLKFFDAANINYPDFIPTSTDDNSTDMFDLVIGKNKIGSGGLLSAKNIYYAEINLEKLLGFTHKYQVTLWSKYPPQIEDITLTVPENTFIGELNKTIDESSKFIVKTELTTIYGNSYTFRVWYQDPKKTLSDNEVEKIRNKFLKLLKDKYGIVQK